MLYRQGHNHGPPYAFCYPYQHYYTHIRYLFLHPAVPRCPPRLPIDLRGPGASGSSAVIECPSSIAPKGVRMI